MANAADHLGIKHSLSAKMNWPSRVPTTIWGHVGSLREVLIMLAFFFFILRSFDAAIEVDWFVGVFALGTLPLVSCIIPST